MIPNITYSLFENLESKSKHLEKIIQSRYDYNSKMRAIMYGMVNSAIERLVCENYSLEMWNQIKAKANVEIDSFSKMTSYPDEITYNLVAASSELLNMSPEKILEAFGEYWTVYVATEGYSDLLKIGGNSVLEFCLNLNNLHSRVGMNFPDLVPPDFMCDVKNQKEFILKYKSVRDGLTPMVIGLLKGLGKLFNEEIEIELIAERKNGAKTDDFYVKVK